MDEKLKKAIEDMAGGKKKALMQYILQLKIMFISVPRLS